MFILFLSLSLSSATSILKKAKRTRRGNVQFDQVTVFFFPRCQGFTSVPSRGGCTLGMMQRHSAQRCYTLAEFAIAQRHLRREKLKNRMREEKLEALKLKVANLIHTLWSNKLHLNQSIIIIMQIFFDSSPKTVPKSAKKLKG